MNSEQVRERLGLTFSEMNHLLATLDADPAAAAYGPARRALLLELALLATHLQEVFGELALGQVWLRTPTPVLGGEAPLHLVLRGQPGAVRRLLTLAETGMPN